MRCRLQNSSRSMTGIGCSGRRPEQRCCHQVNLRRPRRRQLCAAWTRRAPPLITDGPYAEAKEALGGFYVVRADNLDEAISYAAVLAEVGHDHSCVEVRPLADHGE